MPLPLQVARLKYARFGIREFRVGRHGERRPHAHITTVSIYPPAIREPAGEPRCVRRTHDRRACPRDGRDAPGAAILSKQRLARPPRRQCVKRVFSQADRDRLALILQGKRLGFTLTEIRELLAVPASRLREGPADRPPQMCRSDQFARAPAPRHRPGDCRIAPDLYRDAHGFRAPRVPPAAAGTR